MAGFKYRYRLGGGNRTKQDIIMGTASLVEGDTVNLVTGQAVLGATTNANFLGVVLETITGTIGTTRVKVCTDADAVYGVTDANARLIGAPLDLAGASGAQGVAASVNKEFVVAADSSASQETLVRFNVGKHYANKAQ